MHAVAQFNRICGWIAFAWLMGGIPLTLLLRPSYQDMSGVYTSAVAARSGEWDALYPDVGRDRRFYVGNDAVPKPAMVRLAEERHVVGLNPFLYPPWSALLLSPIGFLSFPAAHWTWVFLLCFSSWGLAMLGGRAYALCAQRESRLRGVVVLTIALSMLTYRSIRVQNLSPLVALCLIVCVFSFIGPSRAGRSLAGGIAMMIGGGLKLATAALVPLAVAMRQWRTLALATVLSVALLLASYRIAGPATFREYFTRIGPTLGSSADIASNQSLQGFLLRSIGVTPLPPAVRVAHRALQLVSLAGLLWLIFRLPLGAWREPPKVFAAAAASIGWMLLFSPICWEHYFSYLCPFWGWLIWEATQGSWRRIAALATIATQWVPLPVNPWVHLPEPFNSYMLWGLFVMGALAVARLITPMQRPAAADAHQASGVLRRG